MTPASGRDFSVATSEVHAAGRCLADEATALEQITLDSPDTSMYGAFVGSSAADAEPATTEDVNALLAVLAGAVAALGDRADRTCAAYTAVEDGNVALGDTITGTLGVGGTT